MEKLLEAAQKGTSVIEEEVQEDTGAEYLVNPDPPKVWKNIELSSTNK